MNDQKPKKVPINEEEVPLTPFISDSPIWQQKMPLKEAEELVKTPSDKEIPIEDVDFKVVSGKICADPIWKKRMPLREAEKFLKSI